MTKTYEIISGAFFHITSFYFSPSSFISLSFGLSKQAFGPTSNPTADMRWLNKSWYQGPIRYL